MYKKVTFKALIELAAPPTWSAGIVPVFLGTALAVEETGALNGVILLCTLFISIALQSAVNTLNDYSDFVKGADTAENTDDVNDASLVYNGIDPRHARTFGFVLIAAALVVGLYVILVTSWLALAFAAVGIVVLLLYALPRVPLSYTPFGELASGFVMGGVLTMATYFLQTGMVDFSVLYFALPAIITIGLVMLVNNTSDIEKDAAVGRRTLAVRLGRSRATILLYALIVAAAFFVCEIVILCFPQGWFFLPVMVVATFIPARQIVANGIEPAQRRFNMQAIASVNTRLNFSYALCILLSCLPLLSR
jgi:1,4-dihydroxy-2-naphthoate polyprenyltransferase